MWPLIAAMLCTFIGPLAVAQNGLACRYEITTIIPGPFCEGWDEAPMFARGLSNHDPPWVTGFFTECVVGPDKAFIWPGSGPVQPLQFPGADVNYSYGFDVIDTGLVVGAYAPNDGPWRGFIYDVAIGTWTQVDPVVAEGGCVLRAANNDGMVVGNRTISQTAYSAFIYHNGAYTDLGVMNGPYSDALDVSEYNTTVGWTGNALSANNARAFIHRKGQTTVLGPIPGGISSVALAVNNIGQVCLYGRYPAPDGQGIVARAAIWKNGEFTILEPLFGYRNSIGEAIGNDGTVVGECSVLQNGQAASTATIWRGEQTLDLNMLIDEFASVNLYAALAINEHGQILCEGSDQGGQVAVLLTPIVAPIADINFDCRVGVPDLLLVINEWGETRSVADINLDRTVNIVDLMLVIENWGET